MKTLILLFVGCLLHIGTLLHGQGILNGNFEIYNSGAKFLEGWNVKLVYTVVGLTYDYGMVVGEKSGSRVGVMDLHPEESGPELWLSSRFPEAEFEGNYYLFGKAVGTGAPLILSQSFLVDPLEPILEYRALNGSPGSGASTIYINGSLQTIQLKSIIVPGGFFGRVSDWYVDLTQYAGTTVSLAFVMETQVGLDMVRMTAVPEPSALAFIALFGVGAIWLRRGCAVFRRKRVEEAVSGLPKRLENPTVWASRC